MIILNGFKKRIRDTRAFTMAEALTALIIVLLVASIVAAGIPVAARAYDRVIVASNAELMLSNTVTALRNELCMARDVSVEGTKITYYNPMFDSFSTLDTDGTDIRYCRFAADGLIIKPDATGTTENKTTSEEVIFSSGAPSERDHDMHVTYGSVEYSGGVITFKDLTVLNTKGSPTGVTKKDYSIRVIPK